MTEEQDPKIEELVTLEKELKKLKLERAVVKAWKKLKKAKLKLAAWEAKNES